MNVSSLIENIIFCSLLTLLIAGCRQQAHTASTVSDRELIFGNGGGFSGQVITYTLQENGRLLMQNSRTKESKALKHISEKEAHALINQAAKLEMGKLSFNHPGNMSYFIRLKDKEQVQEITWGSTDQKPPAAIEAFYQQLQNLTAQ